MTKISMRALATKISEREGGKVNLPIAQVSEVLRHALDLLAEERPSAVLALLESRRVRRAR